MSIPVSYTHLDVYKRQVYDHKEELPELFDFILGNDTTVSYTHLDVYKRQPQESPRPDCDVMASTGIVVKKMHKKNKIGKNYIRRNRHPQCTGPVKRNTHKMLSLEFY